MEISLYATFVKRIAAAVEDLDEKGVAQAIFSSYVKPDCPEETLPIIANNLGLIAATKDGNPHRVYWRQKRVLEKRKRKDPKLQIWVPTEDTVYAYLNTFEERLENGGRLLDKWQMWSAVFESLHCMLDVLRECFGLKSHEFFVTIDSTPNPFYGAGNDAALTPSGLASKPEYRTVQGKSVPWFPGTEWGHDFIVMSIHFYGNLVTIPIAVFDVPNLKYDSGECVRKLLECLDQIPEQPLFILLDRGFCNIEVTRHLNAYCNKHRGTFYMLPMVRFNNGPSRKAKGKTKRADDGIQKSMRRALEDHFQDCTLSKQYKDGSFDTAAIIARHWAGDKTVKFTVVAYYRHKPRGKVAKALNSISFALGRDTYCTPFMTNYQVDAGDWHEATPELRKKTEQNLQWLETRYTRWICENAVFKAHKAHLGRIPSDYVGPRYLGFGLGMIMLGIYGLFRWQIQVDGDENGKPYPLHHPELGLDNFLAGMREALELQTC